MILAIIFLGYKGISTIIASHNKDDANWKVEITNNYINVRSKPSSRETKIGEVKKKEKYNILEIYLEDNNYVWYKINFKGKDGWIASSRDNPYVKEINNPNIEDTDSVDYKIDYKKPELRFYDNVYNTYDINSINYDHLDIKDDSPYMISHTIYYEEHPIDTEIPQYWIRYTVTDKFGNSISKVQKIEFTVEPSQSEVKDFSELGR